MPSTWLDAYSVPLSAPLLLVFCGFAWRWWALQPERFPPPRIRGIAGFLALSAATASTVFWATYILGNWVTGSFGQSNWVTLGLLTSVVGFLFSPFAIRKTRVYALGLSILMVLTWSAYVLYSRGSPF